MSLSLIDTINENFIQLGINQSSRDYKKYLDEVVKKVNAKIKRDGSINDKEIKAIIKEVELSNRGYEKTILLMLVLSGATLKMFRSKKSDFTVRRLNHINKFMNIVKPTRPNKFSQKVVKLTNSFLNNTSDELKGRDKKAYDQLEQFYNANKKTTIRIRKEVLANRRKVETLIKNNLSKGIFKDYKDMINQGKSLNTITTTLNNKYNTAKRIRRIVDTETHALAEEVKQIHASAVGLEWKTWRTQGDSRVRDLPNANHKVMNNVTIKINQRFDLQGHLAMIPGDINLPPEQRIGCRCYCTYR